MELNAFDTQVQSTSVPLRLAWAIQKVETPRLDARTDTGPFLRYEGRAPGAPRAVRSAKRHHLGYGTAQVMLLPPATASRASPWRSPIALWMVRLVRRFGPAE
jgi:hypothetical protein